VCRNEAYPPGTSVQSLRIVLLPLNWDEVFDYVGFSAFLKPLGRGIWLSVQRVQSREEFFAAYDRTGPACMLLQAAVQYQKHYRCYVIGDKVRALRFEPDQPAHLRYVADTEGSTTLCERLVEDAQKLCAALGYQINAVEFAVNDGVPYVMDSFNPAPDADHHFLGLANFEWIVEAVADLAIQKATGNTREQASAASS